MHDDAFVAGIEEKAREVARQAGSTMQVACAFEGSDEMVLPQAAGASKTATAAAGAPVPSEGCSLRILIVDDDEDLRVLVGRVLKQSGHQVLEAADGCEALDMIRKDQPDLVLLDLYMPPPDGMEVLRTLRSQPQTANLPVVILTAAGDEVSTRMSFDMGATDFLSKPFSPPQLNARVRNCFARAAGGGIH